MPRLIPRLLINLEKAKARPSGPYPVPEHTQRPQKRDENPPALPSLNAEGRTQSIVLDSLEPIMKRARYKRRKGPIPVVSPQRRYRQVTQAGGGSSREAMSNEELSLWASPYLRMLATPMRQCLATDRILPGAFMIRLAPKRLPSPRSGQQMQLLVPDGLLHPSIVRSKVGHGRYVLCYHEAVEYLVQRGGYKKIGRNLTTHSLLKQQIGHLLRLRALQELQMLARKLERNRAPFASIIRRLTRDEWALVQKTGVIPSDNAVALIVCPPVNRDPITKLRVQPNTSPAPLDDAQNIPTRPRVMYPLGTLCPGGPIMFDLAAEAGKTLPNLISQTMVPRYNGVSMFPSRSQRAALHATLLRLLAIEQKAMLLYRRHVQQGGDSHSDDLGKTQEHSDGRRKEKASHAFLMCSDASTLCRADVVPLAVALWRVWMWEEGPGQERQKGQLKMAGGWVRNM